ncbi:MAG: sialate O-acetylesterase, partial [Tannerellaceae bacterium]
PVNKDLNMFHGHTSKGDVVIATNELIRTFCQNNGYTFVDLYSQMKNDGDEKMNPMYTNDGLHLLGPGYIKWKEIVMPYVKE